MIVMSNSALKYAIDVCRERDNYKIGVVPYSTAQAEAIIETLKISYQNDNDLRLVNKVSFDGFQMQFNNGSLIRIIPSSYTARGNRFHLIIADNLVDRNFLSKAILPYEILEWRDYHNELKEGDKQ